MGSSRAQQKWIGAVGASKEAEAEKKAGELSFRTMEAGAGHLTLDSASPQMCPQNLLGKRSQNWLPEN